jgi:hypothetical protein
VECARVVKTVELEEVPMQIVGALDVHRRQITFKTLDLRFAASPPRVTRIVGSSTARNANDVLATTEPQPPLQRAIRSPVAPGGRSPGRWPVTNSGRRERGNVQEREPACGLQSGGLHGVSCPTTDPE